MVTPFVAQRKMKMNNMDRAQKIICDMFSVVNVYLAHFRLCVVCIDGWRYVCCNVASNECNEPALCNLSAHTLVELSTLGVSLVFCCVMISACVPWISRNLRSSSLFFILFMMTCSMMRFLSLLLLGLCVCVVYVVLWSVCKVVLVQYLDAVTVMCVLLFVCTVC